MAMQGGLNQVAQQTAQPGMQPGAQQASKLPDVSTTAASQILQEEQQAAPQGFDVGREMENLARVRSELDAQIKKMQESLARRQQASVIDPRWAAFTYAMSQPTKTGSAFEAIGSGLQAFSKGEQEEFNRQAEIEKMNLELMTKRDQLQRGLTGQAFINTSLGGAPSGAVNAPMMGQQAAAMTPVGGTVGGFNVSAPVTDAMLRQAQQIGDPATIKFLEDLRKTQIEAIKAEAASEVDAHIPETGQTVKVPLAVKRRYEQIRAVAQETNNPQLLIDFMAKSGMIEAMRSPEGRLLPPKSPAESAAERERVTQTERVRAESSEKSAGQLRDRAAVAFDNIQTANDMISYAKTNPEVFKLLNSGKWKDVVMSALGAGIQTPGGSINLPVDRLKRLGLSDEQINTLQMFAQSAAQLNIQFRRTMQGQGQITEKESQLAAELGAMPTDSDVVIRLKSELLIERSKFDERAQEAWIQYRKSGNSYDDFLASREYKDLKKDYNDTLAQIRAANAELLKKKPVGAPAAPAAPAKPAAEGSVPPGYIRDPQTGVIRKKREGE